MAKIRLSRVESSAFKNSSYAGPSVYNTGADPGFDQGGAQIVTGLNCGRYAAASCERSEPFSAWGPGPTLGPGKLLGISLLNMHSLHFGVHFFTIFEIIKY